MDKLVLSETQSHPDKEQLLGIDNSCIKLLKQKSLGLTSGTEVSLFGCMAAH